MGTFLFDIELYGKHVESLVDWLRKGYINQVFTVCHGPLDVAVEQF